MKILNCTNFAYLFTEKREPWDGNWAEEIIWKHFRNEGFTHVLFDGQLWTMGKFGPDLIVSEIEDYLG